MAAASGDYDSLDWSFADKAGLAFPSINSVLELKKSFFAIGVHVVGNTRAAEPDGLSENFLECRMQLFQFVAGKRSSPPARSDAGPEQCFVCINVAYSA